MLCYYCLTIRDGERWGSWSSWKYVEGQRMFWPPKISHSFIQNCCWITLQVLHHEGWKSCLKNLRWLIFTSFWRVITSRPSYLTQLWVLFLSSLLSCSTVLCLFDYVMLFWANKYDGDDDAEGKTNFSRRLKQFDGLTWLTPTLFILRQIYTTAT